MSNEAELKTILCVDADAESRQLLEELLTGYRTVFACNAFEGLRELHSRAFDLYVLEAWLPDWSGFQLCREVRNTDPHAPILFCTGAAKEQDRARGLRAGAGAYMCKPIDPHEFDTNVRVLLNLAHLESARARVEEERAIQDELARRTAEVMQRTGYARQAACKAVERTAKTKALRAFADAGGTRSNFERWWLSMFSDARTQHGLPNEPDVGNARPSTRVFGVSH